MIQYLSDEWLERADKAVGGSDELRNASKDLDLTIRYDVTGTPNGKLSYGVWFKDGAAGVDVGPHPDAPTSFALDYQTAGEIARGELSAQAAFMQGRLKLDGDVTVLVNQFRAIDGLVDALGELRAETEY